MIILDSLGITAWPANLTPAMKGGTAVTSKTTTSPHKPQIGSCRKGAPCGILGFILKCKQGFDKWVPKNSAIYKIQRSTQSRPSTSANQRNWRFPSYWNIGTLLARLLLMNISQAQRNERRVFWQAWSGGGSQSKPAIGSPPMMKPINTPKSNLSHSDGTMACTG